MWVDGTESEQWVWDEKIERRKIWKIRKKTAVSGGGEGSRSEFEFAKKFVHFRWTSPNSLGNPSKISPLIHFFANSLGNPFKISKFHFYISFCNTVCSNRLHLNNGCYQYYNTHSSRFIQLWSYTNMEFILYFFRYLSSYVSRYYSRKHTYTLPKALVKVAPPSRLGLSWYKSLTRKYYSKLGN